MIVKMENKMKVTVAEFLAKGFKFVEGDCVGDREIGWSDANDLNDGVFGDTENKEVNPPMQWRDNGFEMPCDGDSFVEVIFYDEEGINSGVARQFDWCERHFFWRPSIKNWEVKENQIEKAIRESEVECREADSTAWKPKTAEGLRELAAQLLSEANELERQATIEETANAHVLDLINIGIIQPSQVKEKTKEVIEFYSTF